MMMLPRNAGLEPMEIPGPASLVDVVPTLTSLLGTRWRAPKHGPLNGIDLTSSLLITGREVDRPVFSQSFGGQAPARYTIRWMGRSLHADLHTRRIEMFDLTVDPGEQRPLPISGSGYAEVLRRALCEYLCNETPEPGKAIVDAEFDHELMKQLGYVSGGGSNHRASGAEGCPLRRR